MPIPKEWKSNRVCFYFQTLAVIKIQNVVDAKLVIILLRAKWVTGVFKWSCFKEEN